ncbi:hypothetical protein KFK09_003255 [Dendrobium nobile]|uniref:Uncharacterized protein n=1 Tax=Dendrobium nobile TaxID=94219 RepID=A0A8T3C8I4_DENNO|nr:hypothetical protein KFK09_003255 [Dendrobium nobile]
MTEADEEDFEGDEDDDEEADEEDIEEDEDDDEVGPDQNARIIYIDVAFDLFHAGHLEIKIFLADTCCISTFKDPNE